MSYSPGCLSDSKAPFLGRLGPFGQICWGREDIRTLSGCHVVAGTEESLLSLGKLFDSYADEI